MDQDGELSLYNDETEDYKDMYVDTESKIFSILEEADEQEADVKLMVVFAMGKEEILDQKISNASR